MIPLKSEDDLKMLRISARILSRVMKRLAREVKVGIHTLDIDNLAEELIREENAVAAFKGYKGFPASVCISVNEEIVHGIPGTRELKDGDIVSLDLGVNYEGYFSDAALTIPVGNVASQLRKLIDTTKVSLDKGIKEARLGNRLSDISYAVQRHVEQFGFSVVRQFVGHGIGKDLHEEPEIPNFGKPHQGPILQSGMVLAIEPMVNLGSWESEILDNGWTAVTKDRKASAHFEHTVVITATGPEVLTSLN